MTPLRLSELCNLFERAGLPAQLEGEDRLIRAVNTLEDASEGEISFLSNPKYTNALGETEASAVLLKEDIALPDGISAVRCTDPYAALTVAIVSLHGHRKHPRWGVSDRASIDPSAKIGEGPNIAGGVTISAEVTIGDNCTLYPGCDIGDGVRMGDDCTLHPNVVVYDHCVLGSRVTIHAGSVVGEDGLGYAPQNGKWVKIPQVGRAVIGDDVEIGANCAIDRATLGQTEIGSGTGIDTGPSRVATTFVTVGGTSNVFTPPDIVVSTGATVIFTWAGATFHNVTFPPGVAEPSPTQNTGTFEASMPEVRGLYGYFCSIHGAGMSGSVSVQ